MQVEVTASVDGERELDIAVMLSNLLDNAVEAQKKSHRISRAAFS